MARETPLKGTILGATHGVGSYSVPAVRGIEGQLRRLQGAYERYSQGKLSARQFQRFVGSQGNWGIDLRQSDRQVVGPDGQLYNLRSKES